MPFFKDRVSLWLPDLGFSLTPGDGGAYQTKDFFGSTGWEWLPELCFPLTPWDGTGYQSYAVLCLHWMGMITRVRLFSDSMGWGCLSDKGLLWLHGMIGGYQS